MSKRVTKFVNKYKNHAKTGISLAAVITLLGSVADIIKEHYDNQRVSSTIWSRIGDKEKEIEALDHRITILETELKDR